MFFKKKKPQVPAQETATPLPTIDPQKLLDACDRLQKMIENENEQRKRRLAQLGETAREMSKAMEPFLEKGEATREEIRQEQQAATDWCAQGCPTTESVTVMTPLKIKTPPKP